MFALISKATFDRSSVFIEVLKQLDRPPAAFRDKPFGVELRIETLVEYC